MAYYLKLNQQKLLVFGWLVLKPVANGNSFQRVFLINKIQTEENPLLPTTSLCSFLFALPQNASDNQHFKTLAWSLNNLERTELPKNLEKVQTFKS